MHEFRRLNISWRQEAGTTPFQRGPCNPGARWNLETEYNESCRGYDVIPDRSVNAPTNEFAKSSKSFRMFQRAVSSAG